MRESPLATLRTETVSRTAWKATNFVETASKFPNFLGVGCSVGDNRTVTLMAAALPYQATLFAGQLNLTETVCLAIVTRGISLRGELPAGVQTSSRSKSS